MTQEDLERKEIEGSAVVDLTAQTQAVAVLNPERVWTRSEVLGRPSPVPRSPGIYGWYFDELPDPAIDATGCVVRGSAALLYVGISPKAPPANGRPPSSQSLQSRVRYHYRGNAEGSTLRLTLGCLLSDRLGIQLSRVGSGRRFTFRSEGEAILSEWMAAHAFVCWAVTQEPWLTERAVIGRVDLPLNLEHNRGHRFASRLRAVRADARQRARLGEVFQR